MTIKVRIAMTVNLGDFCNVRPEVEVEDVVRIGDDPGSVSIAQAKPEDTLELDSPSNVAVHNAHRRLHDLASSMWEKEFESSITKLEEKKEKHKLPF